MTPTKPDYNLNAGFEEYEVGGETIKIPVATPDQNRYIENLLHHRCDYRVPKIPEMNAWRLAVLLRRLLSLDLERGKMPGSVPNRIYELSDAFGKWENEVFDKIASREEELGESAEDIIWDSVLAKEWD